MLKYILAAVIGISVLATFVLDNIVISDPQIQRKICVDNTLIQKSERECVVSARKYGFPLAARTEYELLSEDANGELTGTGIKITAEHGAPEVRFVIAETPSTQYGGTVISPNNMLIGAIAVTAIAGERLYNRKKIEKYKKMKEAEVNLVNFR